MRFRDAGMLSSNSFALWGEWQILELLSWYLGLKTTKLAFETCDFFWDSGKAHQGLSSCTSSLTWEEQTQGLVAPGEPEAEPGTRDSTVGFCL